MAASRTCPSCGAFNSELSIFCAECGTSLNTTTATADATVAFQPVATPASSWTSPANAPEPPSRDWTMVAEPEAQTWGDPLPPSSNRGFILGVLAWILVAIIFAAYLWSGVLDSGLKNDIEDLMPWMGAIHLF